MFRAVADRRFTAVAEFVDPDDLAALYEQALASAKHAQERHSRSAADYIRLEPDLPPEVAEYFASREARWAARGSLLSIEYADVESVADVERLSPGEVLGRWIQARDPAYQLLRNAAAHDPPIPADQLERYPLPEIRRKVVGSVLESGDLAHVVYRMAWVPEHEGEIKVASLRRTPSGWRMRFDHDFLGQGNWGFAFGTDGPVDPSTDNEH